MTWQVEVQQIVLLVAGDKAGNWRGWYRTAIPRAEQLYAEHVDAMRAGGEGRPVMRWEDLYEELYDADDRAEIERLKVRLLSELKARRLAQARKSRGLTQRDVAATMGVTVGRVSQIERGEVASVEVLRRYAGAVGGQLRVVIDFGDELIAV